MSDRIFLQVHKYIYRDTHCNDFNFMYSFFKLLHIIWHVVVTGVKVVDYQIFTQLFDSYH